MCCFFIFNVVQRLNLESNFLSVLMQSIREDIEKEHLQIQKCDIVNFFKVAEFVTSFQYHKYLISQVRFELSDIFIPYFLIGIF